MSTNKVTDYFSASAALTITLNALASSTSGVGRQSTLLTGNTHRRAIIYVKITQGTSPTGNKGVYVYLLRGDAHATPHYTDGAGASDAALTILNAVCIGTMANKASPSTEDVLYGEFVVENMGPVWGIAIVHDTAVNLKASDADHWVRYIYVDDDIQAAS
ncbi:MAG: hypothetical protein WC565_09640 [Parcubacteria group bacterium]